MAAAVGVALAGCAAPPPPSLYPLPAAPYQPSIGLAEAKLLLARQGYSDISLIEALRSWSLNPPLWEGSARLDGRQVNIMLMKDGSSVVLPFEPRQKVPPPSVYTCNLVDFDARILTCFGAR